MYTRSKSIKYPVPVRNQEWTGYPAGQIYARIIRPFLYPAPGRILDFRRKERKISVEKNKRFPTKRKKAICWKERKLSVEKKESYLLKRKTDFRRKERKISVEKKERFPLKRKKDFRWKERKISVEIGSSGSLKRPETYNCMKTLQYSYL